MNFTECNLIFQDHLTVIFMPSLFFFFYLHCQLKVILPFILSYRYDNIYNTHVAATLTVWDLLEWILLVTVYTLSITVPIPSPGLVHQRRLQIRVTGTRIVCNQTMYNI